MENHIPVFLGIDNGLNGGIVLIDHNQKIIRKYIMPTIKLKGKNIYDVNEVVKMLKEIKDNFINVHCSLEEAHVRPVSGKRACFTTGGGYFLMLGILTTLEIPFEIVPPKLWQKEILVGLVGQNKDTKEASIMYCKQKYPNISWTKSKRANKAHDGITDACCLAVYCFRRNK